jgi:hypothetical protein
MPCAPRPTATGRARSAPGCGPGRGPGAAGQAPVPSRYANTPGLKPVLLVVMLVLGPVRPEAQAAPPASAAGPTMMPTAIIESSPPRRRKSTPVIASGAGHLCRVLVRLGADRVGRDHARCPATMTRCSVSCPWPAPIVWAVNTESERGLGFAIMGGHLPGRRPDRPGHGPDPARHRERAGAAADADLAARRWRHGPGRDLGERTVLSARLRACDGQPWRVHGWRAAQREQTADAITEPRTPGCALRTSRCCCRCGDR